MDVYLYAFKNADMKTVTVELRNNNALNLLKNLELIDVIRVIDEDSKGSNGHLAASLRGSISKNRAQDLNNQLEQSREEWENRNI